MSEIPEDIIERAAGLHASLNVLSYMSFVPPEGAELIEHALLAERLAERERCAKVAEARGWGKSVWPVSSRDAHRHDTAEEIAAAILRGDTP